MKPSNGVFLAAPLLALAFARRWRHLALLAAAMAPPIATLAIWKSRGLGQIPALALGGDHALAAFAVVLPLAGVFDAASKYLHLDWGMLNRNLDQLREFFWSVRPLEWVPLGGTVAAVLRSAPKGVLLGTWFAGYILIKGTSGSARVEDASFFRLVMPAFPAFILFLAALPLLVPRLGARIAGGHPVGPVRRPHIRIVAAAGIVFALVPFILVVASSPQRGARVVKYFDQNVFVPIDQFPVTAKRSGDAVQLSWPAVQDPSAQVFYRVFRAPPSALDPDKPDVYPPLVAGVNCVHEHPGSAADCRLKMETISVTTQPGFVDHAAGSWSYRVGVSANWRNDSNLGDVVLVSRAATVTSHS
jgi:hypothetical protein